MPRPRRRGAKSPVGRAAPHRCRGHRRPQRDARRASRGDLAAHVVAAEGFGLPDSLAAGFTLLEKHGIIEAAISSKLRATMGFRNVAVHSYETVDPRVVEAIATHHVEDLRRFAAAMVERYAT